MDQQQIDLERIGKHIAERYPMYQTNPGFEQWLFARTGTDPEKLDRYLDLLDDYGYILGDGMLADGYTQLPEPEGVTADIEGRLARLDPEACALLRVASVEGERFGTEVFTAVGEDQKNVERLLRSAQEAGVIAPDRHHSSLPALGHRYRFVPLQARAVLYDQLSEDERQSLHNAMVEYLGEQVRTAGDPGAQDMLNQLISEHNRQIARPIPPPSKTV